MNITQVDVHLIPSIFFAWTRKCIRDTKTPMCVSSCVRVATSYHLQSGVGGGWSSVGREMLDSLVPHWHFLVWGYYVTSRGAREFRFCIVWNLRLALLHFTIIDNITNSTKITMCLFEIIRELRITYSFFNYPLKFNIPNKFIKKISNKLFHNY